MSKIPNFQKLIRRKAIAKLRKLPLSFWILPTLALFIILSQQPQILKSLEYAPVEIINGDYAGNIITCSSPVITDGDTFRCDGIRIRLEGIDTPEMPGHCRPGRECTKGDPYAAKDYLESISRGTVTCTEVEKDHYGRTVARCESDGQDLSCAMLDSEYAVRRYGHISC